MARDSVSRHDLPWGPSTLVTDFIHSANIKQPRAKDEAENFRVITGTDMFIACDLGQPGSVSYFNDSAALPFILADVDEYPKGPDALAAAFPSEEDVGFLDTINRVVPEEAQRRLQVRRVGASSRSKRATPAESLFWVHLWGSARAQPQNAEFADGDRSRYNAFCATMLRHKIGGGNKEAGRALYLSPQPLDKELFHPRFQRVQELFLQMTLYLTTPWHIYEDEPYIKEHPDHAYVAFRRLLLGMLLRDDIPELDDLLKPERPRLIDEGESHLGRRSATSTPTVAAKTPGPLSVNMEKKERNPSTKASAWSTSQVSALSQKRAREETHVDDRAAKKMRVDVEHEQDIRPMAVDTPKTVTEDQLQVDEGKDDTASILDLKTQRYTPAIRVHQPLQTVNALRLEKWKDKAHWFEKGKSSPPTKESAA